MSDRVSIKFCRKIKLTCSISAGITLFKELLHCDSKCNFEVLLQVHFCYESCSNLMFFTRYKINAYSFWFAFCKFQEIIFPKCFLPCSCSMLLYYFYHGFVLFCLKTPWLICFKQFLTLSAPTPQNGQTHSNNSSAIWIVWVHLTILRGWRLKG